MSSGTIAVKRRFFCAIIYLAVVSISGVSPGCPIQCQCLPNRMSCEAPGLNRLPSPYTSQLEYLLVENQTFDSTHLGPAELKVYQTPEFGGQVRLKNLHIRYCNIRTIGRQAFQELGPKLEVLDLSGNPLKHIGDYAFAGLGQLTLILDRIDQPMFDDHAFAGLSRMKSLIVQHSNLVTLPYQPLLQLTSDGRLDNLLIKGNQLRTLDNKFEAIFQSLQNFNINDNPWECDCQLNWLIRRYQFVLKDHMNFDENRKRRWGESSQMSDWAHEDSQPRCASPALLYGRNFSDLITNINDVYFNTVAQSKLFNPPTIIYCPPPQLESFDIDLEEHSSSERSERLGELQTIHRKSVVRLKCVVKGSRQLLVSWQYHDPIRGIQAVSNSDTTKLNNSPDRWSSRPDMSIKTESNVYLEPREPADTYSCLGQDVIGNVSTLVRIKWPDQPVVLSVNTPVTSSQSSGNNKDSGLSMWTDEILAPSHSLLHAPQFSLSQLLGAVAGTFFSTILLFFFIHCVLHNRLGNCGLPKRSTHGKKIETRNVIRSGTSPGETSSSNTSFSNPNLISPKLGDSYLNSIPNHMSPEAIPITANMITPHTFHQLMNGPPSIGTRTALPTELTHPTTKRQPDQPSTYPSNMVSDGTGVSVAYEPVSYSDANNLTYDVPWMLNRPDGLRSHGNTEQHIPLLFNGAFTDHKHPVDLSALSHSGLIQSALMIPPPPSMPQPSLPSTPNSINLAATLNRPPSSNTNLVILQAAYPANHSALMNGCGQGYTGTTALNAVT